MFIALLTLSFYFFPSIVTSQAFKSNVLELCRVLGICPHVNHMVSFEACLKAIKKNLDPEKKSNSAKNEVIMILKKNNFFLLILHEI